MFVVDNSVVMAWCFEDEKSEYADRVLDRLTEDTAIVPEIWPFEVVNVLAVAERKKRLGVSDSTRFLKLLSQLPIRVAHESPEKMMQALLPLSRARTLSSYDIAYLDLAMREGCPIATLDTARIEAAGRSGVPILLV